MAMQMHMQMQQYAGHDTYPSPPPSPIPACGDGGNSVTPAFRYVSQRRCVSFGFNGAGAAGVDVGPASPTPSPPSSSPPARSARAAVASPPMPRLDPAVPAGYVLHYASQAQSHSHQPVPPAYASAYHSHHHHHHLPCSAGHAGDVCHSSAGGGFGDGAPLGYAPPGYGVASDLASPAPGHHHSGRYLVDTVVPPAAYPPHAPLSAVPSPPTDVPDMCYRHAVPGQRQGHDDAPLSSSRVPHTPPPGDPQCVDDALQKQASLSASSLQLSHEASMPTLTRGSMRSGGDGSSGARRSLMVRTAGHTAASAALDSSDEGVEASPMGEGVPSWGAHTHAGGPPAAATRSPPDGGMRQVSGSTTPPSPDLQGAASRETRPQPAFVLAPISPQEERLEAAPFPRGADRRRQEQRRERASDETAGTSVVPSPPFPTLTLLESGALPSPSSARSGDVVCVQLPGVHGVRYAYLTPSASPTASAQPVAAPAGGSPAEVELVAHFQSMRLLKSTPGEGGGRAPDPSHPHDDDSNNVALYESARPPSGAGLVLTPPPPPPPVAPPSPVVLVREPPPPGSPALPTGGRPPRLSPAHHARSSPALFAADDDMDVSLALLRNPFSANDMRVGAHAGRSPRLVSPDLGSPLHWLDAVELETEAAPDDDTASSLPYEPFAHILAGNMPLAMKVTAAIHVVAQWVDALLSACFTQYCCFNVERRELKARCLLEAVELDQRAILVLGLENALNREGCEVSFHSRRPSALDQRYVPGAKGAGGAVARWRPGGRHAPRTLEVPCPSEEESPVRSPNRSPNAAATSWLMAQMASPMRARGPDSDGDKPSVWSYLARRVGREQQQRTTQKKAALTLQDCLSDLVLARRLRKRCAEVTFHGAVISVDVKTYGSASRGRQEELQMIGQRGSAEMTLSGEGILPCGLVLEAVLREGVNLDVNRLVINSSSIASPDAAGDGNFFIGLNYVVNPRPLFQFFERHTHTLILDFEVEAFLQAVVDEEIKEATGADVETVEALPSPTRLRQQSPRRLRLMSNAQADGRRSDS